MLCAAFAIMGLFQRLLGHAICYAQQNLSSFLSGVNNKEAIQYVDNLK